jgi:hypothetical protein
MDRPLGCGFAGDNVLALVFAPPCAQDHEFPTLTRSARVVERVYRFGNVRRMLDFSLGILCKGVAKAAARQRSKQRVKSEQPTLTFGQLFAILVVSAGLRAREIALRL